jgi:hypothetical protein
MSSEIMFEKLDESLKGKLIYMGDDDYDEARKVWNGRIDKHPLFVAKCADENDVQNTIKFTGRNNIVTAVRGGGHSVAGLGTCDNGAVIDLSPMKRIEINTKLNTVWAQAGLTWQEFDKTTQKYGLATTGSLFSDTGLAGHTLNGGYGWLSRKYGFTADNLLSVEMVLADGNQITASPNENEDLFWGIRGGGGNFGVVTSFELKLHPVGQIVYGGAIYYPMSKAKELLTFYREWTWSMPNELSTMVLFLTLPPEPFVPENYIGQQMIGIAVCYTGPVEEGEKIVQPLRGFSSEQVDFLGPIHYTALQSMFDFSVPKGIHSYWKTHHLLDINNYAIDILLEHVSRMKALSAYSAVHIYHWEGAIKNKNSADMSFARRDARFVLNIIGAWMGFENPDKHINWARRFSRTIQPLSIGQFYLNYFPEGNEKNIRAAFGAKNYNRLIMLKNKYDPKNFFRVNHNIKPTVSSNR